MKQSSAPSESQLELLDLLWRGAPLSVRQLHEALVERRAAAGHAPLSYTTVLTQLQRMHDAGLVERDTAARSHLYRPAVPREDVELGLFGRLAERAFGGSRVTLALRALGTETPTAEELAELREWLNQRD